MGKKFSRDMEEIAFCTGLFAAIVVAGFAIVVVVAVLVDDIGVDIDVKESLPFDTEEVVAVVDVFDVVLVVWEDDEEHASFFIALISGSSD
jgi:hypothetical protein